MKRPKLWVRVGAALVMAVFALVLWSYWFKHVDNHLWATGGSQENYYWSTAQMQIALSDVELQARLVAIGAPLDKEVFDLKTDILSSRIHVLISPSELRERYRRIPGFEGYSTSLVEFAQKLEPLVIDVKNERVGAAAELVRLIQEVKPVVFDLANSAWEQDSADKESSLKAIGRRQAAVTFSIFFLCLALVGVVIAWRRYIAAAKGRESALEAERRAVRVKTQFLAMVSHELRSPLQSIVSALDVLERPQSANELAEVTRRIRRSANELTVQLRDMLTLARGQEGRISIRPEVFEAGEMVKEAIEDLRRDAEAKGIRFDVETPDAPVFIVADGVRIGQLLQNLVGNAVRYTGGGGMVAVTLRPFEGELGPLRIRIADTGPGLPDSAMLMLSTGVDTAQHGQRRGIGLAVVRALLLQLDGAFNVSSSKEMGTAFELAVPAVKAEDRPPVRGSGGSRILIVDDRPDLLAGFSQVCADLGLMCDTASSTAIAFNLLAAHDYGAVLVDLELSGTSGAEFAIEVKNAGLNGEARMVAMTAGQLDEVDLTSFDAVLEKPIGSAQLAAAMRVRVNP